MQSDYSSASATSSDRRCRVCAEPITTGRRDRKVCGDVCRREDARSRASAWYAEHGRREDVVLRRREADRRRLARDLADPETRERRRQAAGAWRAANPDKRLAHERAYRAANPEAIREKLHRRRARLLGAYVGPVDVDLLWERDEGLCGICGEPIDRYLPWPDRRSLTVDHIVPLAEGGSHEQGNAQLAHAGCNSRKGSSVPAA